VNPHIRSAFARARMDEIFRESARQQPAAATAHETQRARVIASLLRFDRPDRERPT
jgi:hypothetical protein